MRQYDARMVETMKHEVELMDGAEESISFFKENQLPVALATCSTMAHVDAALDKHDLRRHFDLVVSAADQMEGKPHPEVYLRTAELLKIDPVRCLAIEDSFFGVIAAKAAKMKVIAMPDPGEYEQTRFGAADMKIKSLFEIDEEAFNKLQKL